MIPLRDSEPSYSKPVVTIGLILVNVAVFLYQASLDRFSLNHLIETFGVIPDRPDIVDLFTSMFLHGGWMHLIGNMWFLWIYGDNVEDVLGKGKFLVFYLACGVVAALTHLLLNPYSRVPTIGASGAIAGVMGAYLLKFPHSRIVTLVPLFVFFTTMEIPAVLILAYWLVLQFFSGVGSIGRSHLSEGGVAWFAHIGGFLAGMILIKVMGTRERYRQRRDFHW